MATTELYRGDSVGINIIQDSKGNWKLDNYNNTVNVSAAVRFKNITQRDQDHLPGTGLIIAPDDSGIHESIQTEWDCTTGKVTNS